MKKICLALMAVAIMVLSPAVPAWEEADAADSDDSSVPEPKQYMYAITTDSKNVNITKVRASENGSALKVISEARTAGGASNISGFWDFDRTTGMGPFNSFYAAINIEEGSGYDSGERMLSSAVGSVAFVLDPYDLSKTLGGTAFEGMYNIMLVIPTVYWKATSTTLYLSSSSSYNAGGSVVKGMTAYAHTATLPDGSTKVFPYIAIGVYEASVSDGKLLSVSGATPACWTTNDGFKLRADALTPAPGSDYQQWNFYQWTLYKMMAYTVMGTKNSQAMLGDGPVSNSSVSKTGLADAAGPYADSTSTYTKLLIENPWGSLYQFVGDTCFFGRTLQAGNTLGGATISNHPQSEVSGDLPSSDGWISATYSSSAYWDLPRSVGKSSTGFSCPGDRVWSSFGWCSLCVGGSDGSSSGVSSLFGNRDLSYSRSDIGSRLAYVMAADAAAVTFEESGLRYRALSGDDASLVGYTGRPVNVSVPDTVTHGGHEFAVVSVGDKAFYGCRSVESVDLGTVNVVGTKAFANCANLASLTVPGTVSKVGPYAFYRCSSLASLAIPNDDVVVCKYAFYGCTGLESASFTGSGVKIGDKTFYRCISLASLDLSGVSKIGAKAFSHCYGLTELTICGTVTSVGQYAFYRCSSLASVVIEDGVASLARSTFSECMAITSLEVGGGLAEVGPNAFYGLAFRDAGGEALAPTADNLRGHAFAGSSMILDLVS